MTERFAVLLTFGGKSNSLGRANEVIQAVLDDERRLDELYDCLFHGDPWVRMRAADSLEKICRQHPDWLLPYIDRLQSELDSNPQPSIQWHLAQIYRQVELSPAQKQRAIAWLRRLLSIVDIDWIVAANAMDTLVQFTRDGSVTKNDAAFLLTIQRQHPSKSVVKRANKLLAELG